MLFFLSVLLRYKPTNDYSAPPRCLCFPANKHVCSGYASCTLITPHTLERFTKKKELGIKEAKKQRSNDIKVVIINSC